MNSESNHSVFTAMRVHCVKFVLIATVIGSALLYGCGSETEPARQVVERSIASEVARDVDAWSDTLRDAEPTQPTQPSPEDVAKAREILADVGRVYREAPTLTDTVTLTLQGQPQSMQLRFDRDNRRIAMSLPTASAFAIDDTLYMKTEVMYDVYYSRPLDGMGVDERIAELGWVPPYHFAMRRGGDVDAQLQGLGLGLLRAPRVRGYEHVTQDEQPFHVVLLDDPAGMMRMYVDSETMLIRRVSIRMRSGPGDAGMNVSVVMNPIVADELTEPIVFPTERRRRVETVDELTPRPLKAGDTAPDFELRTLDGSTVRLSDLRGDVVVLDFWATWCIPCILALPHLDRLSQWAEEQPRVHVFAVNTMEQAASAQDRRALAEQFWSEQAFTVPVLLDDENRVVMRYGYNSIPMTLVIDPDGRIARTHDHFSRNMFQILKGAVERALQDETGRQ